MNALECKLKKAATDAQDKQKAEAAKATEAKTQMDEWKKKAEEAAKKITSLEHAVKEAAEAKEAKAAVARAEATVAELRATLAKERAEAAKSADAMASDLKQQVYATRKMLEESNARVLSLETRTQEADELVEELGRQLEASAGALSKAAHEASIAAEKASKEKAHALLLAEEEAVRRCNAAAAAAAEAAREETREQLVAEWSKKLADATTFAADEMQAVKESLEAEMHDVKRALEADVAERDARVAARDADVASLTRAASEQTTRVAALEEEAMSLHAEIQNARADVVAQREAAAEESKRMDAAHAAAVRVLNERRREEAAAAETRAREMEASHENEKRALEARSELKGKRLSWAFSASRAIMNETNEALKTEHDEMKRKFDNRESRDDDLRVISSLKQEVTILQSMCVRLESNAKQMSLQLDNRNTNDYVFGSASKAGRPRTVTGERAGYLYKPVSPPGETRPHTVNPHAPAGHRKLVGSASASVKKRRGERGAAFGESPLASQTVPAMGTGGRREPQARLGGELDAAAVSLRGGDREVRAEQRDDAADRQVEREFSPARYVRREGEDRVDARERFRRGRAAAETRGISFRGSTRRFRAGCDERAERGRGRRVNKQGMDVLNRVVSSSRAIRAFRPRSRARSPPPRSPSPSPSSCSDPSGTRPRGRPSRPPPPPSSAPPSS